MAKARIAFGISLTSLTALFCGLAAAVEPLRLEDYVPADFHRRFLSAQPRLNWGASDGDYENGKNIRDISDNGLDGNLELTHGSERFSQNRRWNLNCGSRLNMHDQTYDRDERYPGETTPANYMNAGTNQSFDYSAYTRLSVQQYLRGRFFVAPYASLNWNQTPLSYNESSAWTVYPGQVTGDSLRFMRYRSESEHGRIYLSGSAKVAAGFGRIQDVRFAETGLFILDRIAATTGKPLALDSQGMRHLQGAVEERRKTRPFMDSRHAAIYDLETVAAFLQDRRGGEALPARAILEMADEWRFGGGHDRKSGWEAKAYPFAEWLWTDTEEDRKNWRSETPFLAGADADPDSLARLADAAHPSPLHEKTRQFEAGTAIGGGARIDWSRPWNRYWQFNAMATGRAARVSKEFGNTSKPDSAGVKVAGSHRYLDLAYPSFEAQASFETAWYPNSRTALSATTGLTWSHTGDYLGSKAGLANMLGRTPVRKSVSVVPALMLGGEYWLNDRMTASGNARYSWEYGDSQDAVDHMLYEGERLDDGSRSLSAFHLDAGLRYYLF